MNKKLLPWITDALVLNLLKKVNENKTIKIDSWNIEIGAPDGTGFLSSTSRIKVLFRIYQKLYKKFSSFKNLF